MYEYGLGVSKDNYRAAGLYFWAAKQGCLEAKKNGHQYILFLR